MSATAKDISSSDYMKKLFGNEQDVELLQDKVKNALIHAHDIRKFEIELYWKRALYFWGFVLTLFGGYILLLTEANGMSACVSNSNQSCILDFILLALVAIAGFGVSIAWHYTEKGSKSIMENWERHIDYLEFFQTGHLHKT